jgi:hypothetical protein
VVTLAAGVIAVVLALSGSAFWLIRRSPHWFVQSWPHQRLRECYFRLSAARVPDVLFMTVASGTAFLNVIRLGAAPLLRVVAFGLLFALVALVVWRVIVLARTGGEEGVRQKVVFACLKLLHEEVFEDSDHFRLTFFVRDPLFRQGWSEHQEILVPYLRKKPGGGNPTRFNSRVYYRLDSFAVTAIAWCHPGEMKERLKSADFELFLNPFPRQFQTRAEMIQHYVDVLKIDKRVVDRISDEMISVVAILSLPLVDGDGQVFGLISIDSTAPFSLYRPSDHSKNCEAPSSTSADALDSRVRKIDSSRLAACLRSTQAILSKLGLPT